MWLSPSEPQCLKFERRTERERLWFMSKLWSRLNQGRVCTWEETDREPIKALRRLWNSLVHPQMCAVCSLHCGTALSFICSSCVRYNFIQPAWNTAWCFCELHCIIVEMTSSFAAASEHQSATLATERLCFDRQFSQSKYERNCEKLLLHGSDACNEDLQNT